MVSTSGSASVPLHPERHPRTLPSVEALVGVLVGGFVTAVVQWVVTPRVQRRVRVDLRREDSLLALGRLLTEEIPRLRERLVSAGNMIAFMYRGASSSAVDAEDPDIRDLIRRDKDTLTSAADSWRQADTRLDWLMGRIGEYLSPLHRTYKFASMRAPTRTDECESLSDDERERLWRAEYGLPSIGAFVEDAHLALESRRSLTAIRAPDDQ